MTFTVSDHLSGTQHLDTTHDRFTIPFALPQQKKADNMPHAEYIANAIRKDIQTFRIESFSNFGIQVTIHPVSSAFELYDLKGKWLGFNRYTFEPYGAEAKNMHVTIDHGGNVKIKYLGAWRPISACLENLNPQNAWEESATREDLVHLRWRQQADWWKENGKTFPLMKLPVEIREMVFEHVWGPVIEPYPTNSSRKLTKLGKISRKIRIPNSKLLLASRQVTAEASNILYLRTPFLIQHYSVMKALTSNVEQRNRIRHLQLGLSHDEFMNLFSADHIRRDKRTGTEVVGLGWPALALRSMKLSSLRIIIAPPSLITKNGKFDGACQRVAVDMIMEAAWAVIRGHPLEITGYVKDVQKDIYRARDVLERKRVQAWQMKRAAWRMPEGSLAEYDEEIDEEVGGVRLDGSRPETAPEEVPGKPRILVCHCDPPCKEETWTSSA